MTEREVMGIGVDLGGQETVAFETAFTVKASSAGTNPLLPDSGIDKLRAPVELHLAVYWANRAFHV
jgi:hypothetical protein